MDWPGLVKKYVWDEEKTPYLVRSDRLTSGQVRSELFVYAFLLAILASVVFVVALTGDGRIGGVAAPLVAPYAMTILAGAIVLGVSGHPAAAAYCATAPLALGLASALRVLRPDMGAGEALILVVLSFVWLGYAARIMRIARRLHRRD